MSTSKRGGTKRKAKDGDGKAKRETVKRFVVRFNMHQILQKKSKLDEGEPASTDKTESDKPVAAEKQDTKTEAKAEDQSKESVNDEDGDEGEDKAGEEPVCTDCKV